MSAHTQVHMNMYCACRGPRLKLGVFFDHCPPYFWRQGLSLNLQFPSWLGWSVRVPVLSVLQTTIAADTLPGQLLQATYTGYELRSLYACGKPFTN